MQKFIPAILLLALLLPSCKDPGKVLLITGGHAYDTLEFHQTFLGLEDFETEALNHPEALPRLAGLEKGDVDVLVFYDFLPGMDPSDSIIYLRLMDLGIPMLFLHHSICNMQRWEGYARMVGGKYQIPEYTQDSTLWSDYEHDLELEIQVLAPEHPVCEGLEDFVIHDEAYSKLRVSDEVELLLGTGHPDCHPRVGWTHMAGNAQVVYLIFGHDKKAYANENFRKLLINSLHWLCK